MRPNHCQFRKAPRMTLLHLHHHHHHLDPLYNRTIQFHLHHHHLFNQPHGAGAFVLHGQTETTPHSVVNLAPTIDDTQTRIDRIEQRIKSLHVLNGVMGWDGYDDLPVAALQVKFHMPNIERYTGIGCPRIHLQL